MLEFDGDASAFGLLFLSAMDGTEPNDTHL